MAIKILQGDCIEKMRELPDECVHCCVTSPPYYGLRSYLSADDPNKASEIGAEQTPEQYVVRMVEVFREVRRVLRNDGTLWLNLGDSYYNYRPGRGQSMLKQTMSGKDYDGRNNDLPIDCPRRGNKLDGLKEKDLIGIPHRVAFALQQDGWYLRAICPWLKRNGMPESTRDRPTQVIEYVFLLSKSPKYFYDAEAVKMDGAIPAGTKGAKGSAERSNVDGVNARPPEYKVYDGKRARRTSDWFFDSLMSSEEGDPLAFVCNTKPYKGAHFATFPPKLIEPCILASTSAHGCCSKCEAPWERIVMSKSASADAGRAWQGVPEFQANRSHPQEPKKLGSVGTPVSQTVGWKATCDCNAEIEPCVVLDPFGGSGTTGQVAQQHGRKAVLIALNASYIPLIEERTGVAA